MEFTAAAADAKQSSAVKKSPTDFLKQVIGKRVVVKLHSGVTYKGVLACLDGFMNIAMEQTEEYVDDQLKNKYGDCFIRGNNGKPLISADARLTHTAFPQSSTSALPRQGSEKSCQLACTIVNKVMSQV